MSCNECKHYIDKLNRCKLHGRFAKIIPCPDFKQKPTVFQQNFDELL